MWSRLLPFILTPLQVGALVFFFTVAPLTHLHDNRTAQERHDAGAEDALRPGKTFHAHLEGHHPDQDGSHHGSRDGGEDSATVPHGKLDLLRNLWSAEPMPVLTSRIENALPLATAFVILSLPNQDAHGPPLPVLKPVRAPPSFS